MFHPIDYNIWDRREIYEAFRNVSYALTVQADITEFIGTLNRHNLKFYPAINYILAKTVQSDYRFRFGIHEGAVGYWDEVHPLYTLLRNGSDHLFTHKYTRYRENFKCFYDAFEKDRLLAENCDRLYYDDPLLPNLLCTSVMPGLSFSSLAFHSQSPSYDAFVPFATVGRYTVDSQGKTTLPVTVEFCHEVNDGYHAELFFRIMQNLLDTFKITD